MKRETLLCLITFLASVASQQSPSKVQGVTRTVQGSSPALRASWSAAVSSGRQGLYSDRVQRNACNVPSRPTLTAVYYKLYLPSEVGVTVSWRAPQSDCPITSYEVQYKISSDTSWSTPPVSKSSRSREHNWRGLSPNTSYDVRVRAVSAAGNGAWSDVGQATTPGVPGPVRSLSAIPIAVNGVPALRVRWSPPVDKAQGNLTYRLRVVPPHVTISSGVTATEYNVTGLNANTRYTVYVRAVSLGPYGPEVSAVSTTMGSPGPVRSPTATPIAVNGVPALRVSWSPPVDKAQGGLTYRLRVVPPHVTISRPTRATVYIVTGLRANTRYTVHVRAVSSRVYGPEVSIANTTLGSPGPVRSPTATPIAVNGVPALRVRWSPPVDKAQGGLTYRLRVVPPHVNISRPVTATEYIVIGLRANTRYTVHVRAVSSLVYGREDSTVGTTGERPPSFTVKQRTGQRLSTSSVALRISPSVGSRYVVFYREDGQQFTKHPTTFSSANNVVITGLQSNTGYIMRVQASNDYGSTNSSDVDVYTLPEGPTDLILSLLSSTSVLCSWTPPGNHRKTPLVYAVSNGQSEADPTAETSLTLSGLQPYKEYTISVKAQNRIGSSAPVTGTVRTYSDTPSGRPQRITSSTKGTSWIEITWSIPPAGGRNGIIINYVIDLSSQANRITVVVQTPTFSTPENLSYNITGLSAGSEYKVRVAASTVNGTGPFTGEVRISTLDDVPGLIRNLSSEILPPSQHVRISWVAPAVTNGDIVSYEVTYGVLDEGMSDLILLTNFDPKMSYIELTNLDPGIPYNVTVRAKTNGGYGDASSIVVFSKEGKPQKMVDGVTVEWTSDNSILVTWMGLSYAEAKGFPVYVVTYTPRNGGSTGSINTTSNSVTLTGLDSRVTHVISVLVTTGKGMYKGNATSVTLQARFEELNPTGAIVGVLLAIILVGTVVVVTVVICLCVKKKKPPVYLSGGMTKVQGVRHSLKKKQKDQDYEMQPQPEVAYYQSLTVGSLEPIPQSSFSVHVKAMHMERDSGFEREYQSIVNDPNGSAEIAMENRPKNRYFNIHTYDHSRVVLSAPDEDGSDYINASYIDGYGKKDAYIASQGPIVETISDFWEMVWEQKSSVIVMLTKVEEKGKVKCEQYWCEELDKPYELKRNLTVTTRSHKAMADFEIRDIRVMKHDDWQSKPLDVVHMQYTGWPDYGVPTHPSSLVKFVQQVRKEYKDSTAPMVVHCSAGVGRSGTFITIDAMMERLKEKDDLNIYQFVTEMRSKRTFMVQTMDQYAFIHDALSDYLTCGDTTIPAHHLTAKIIEMSAVKEETNTTEFQDQFEFLESLSKNTCAEDDTYSKKTTIAKKNRYKDKFPYSNCHLKLHSRNSSNGGDYINASFIDSFSRSKGFIAAQAPLENTKNDVWQLIWQFKIPTVVVLCGFKEERQVTCCRFWPDETNKSIEYDHIKVNHDRTISKTGYEMTRLDAFEKGMDTNQVSVTLFHVNNWSKSGSVDLNSVLKLMGDVEGAHTKKKKPIMVMCDDGMGRSGVFICAMSEVERVKFEGQVDVFQTIKGMRIQRPHMVDTPEHYKLCFDILLTHLDSFDTYANFKVV